MMEQLLRENVLRSRGIEDEASRRIGCVAGGIRVAEDGEDPGIGSVKGLKTASETGRETK